MTSTNKDPILVVVQLTGGSDYMNMVVPYADPLYYDNRPTVGIPAEDVLQINDRFGFNPVLGAVKNLYDQGQVAVVNGVGYANPIVSDEGVSPLLMDVSDWKVSVGAGLYLDDLRVDFVFGYGVPDDRNIDASEALIIPGTYRMGGNFIGLGLEWEG